MNHKSEPSARVPYAAVSSEPISVDALRRHVLAPDAGAVVTFDGVVRDHDEGRAVRALSYSAHPTADEVIAKVAVEVADEFPAVTLSVAHRIGDLAIGDAALVCVVASAHRSVAFDACRELVDRVKERVPIWKEQTFDNGTVEWVNAID